MTIKTKLNSLAKLLSGDDEKKWFLAERSAKFFNKNAVLGEHNKIWRTDPDFIADTRKLPNNDRQLERLYVIEQLAKYCSSLKGDYAECGTYLGSSAFFLAKHAPQNVCLFDSWEGLSEPADVDGNYWSKGDLISSLESAQENLKSFTNVQFFKGWIPSRFIDVSHRSFALVHIDVDIYQPTKDALEFFWEKILPGGIIVCDDYGFANCAGAKKALDDFFASVSHVISLPTGQALVIKKN
jgi:predicted O-methyltransferase YrrM